MCACDSLQAAEESELSGRRNGQNASTPRDVDSYQSDYALVEYLLGALATFLVNRSAVQWETWVVGEYCLGYLGIHGFWTTSIDAIAYHVEESLG